jgi:hypothetical protein
MPHLVIDRNDRQTPLNADSEQKQIQHETRREEQEHPPPKGHPAS